jgi:hypothetical protein
MLSLVNENLGFVEQVLERIRGTKDVDAEFEDIKDAVTLANSIAHPFRNLLRRKHRPLLVAAILIPLFQQFTGYVPLPSSLRTLDLDV